MSRGVLLAAVFALAVPVRAHGQVAAAIQAPAPQAPSQASPSTQDSAAASPAAAVPERLSFEEAVRRATTRNPSVAAAATDILRADGLLRQARAATLPAVGVSATNTTLDGARGLGNQVFTPQNTFSAALSVSMPLVAPADWARRAQAQDQRMVAEAGTEDVKKQVAVATAQAYLAVIATHRVVESQVRARDTAQAFYDYAHNRQTAGAASRLTELQAQQTLSTDQALVEQARLALYRAQEALGVLVAGDVPIDSTVEPAFEIPDEQATIQTADQAVQQRTDIKLANLQILAARRVVSDSWKDWLPSVTGIFQPAYQHPGSLVVPETSWRALLQFGVPLFDSGARSGAKQVREAALQRDEARLVGQVREAKAEVRRAYESLRRSERVLESARAASAQAAQVLQITEFSFKAGASTNLDVIDAQRRARDADTSVAIAEDGVRQSRLDLLTALGRFP
jgi:outer membrane protein TolC